VINAVPIFAIGASAAVALGVADFFGARASKNTGPIIAAFCVQVVGAVAFCLWYLVSRTALPTMPAGIWVYALTGALLMGAGMCTLYLAFERGPVSLASPLSAAYPLVTAVVGVLFFDAALSAAECVAVVVIVVGVMAASGLFGIDKTERTISSGPRLALLTTVFWGVAYPLLGQAINTVGWEVVTLIQLIAMLPVLGAMLALRSRPEQRTATLVARTLGNPFVLAAGLLQMLAILAINFGFGIDQAAGTMVVATSAAYPVITILLALRHFDENINALALAGAGLTVAGVLALHTF
jgi:drug/metabolite transporter (DMT)-like permease